MSDNIEYDGEDRRRAAERRDCQTGYCPLHSERDKDITEMKDTLFNDIKPRVYSQDGKLTILMWGIGLFCVFALGLGVSMAIFSSSMDKTFSSYIASHTVEAAKYIEIIGENKAELHESQKAIAILLENQRDHKNRIKRIESSLFSK